MKIVLQRVSEARVEVDGNVVGSISKGLLLLVGIGKGDTEAVLDQMAEKVINLRIFPDELGKMNLSLIDVDGAILAVSQFTLFGDVRKGRRPSFEKACPPGEANLLFDFFVQRLREKVRHVATGEFGARMQVYLTNDGPVTLILEHPEGAAG
ncbi:D-tyrosyl-tRNA(Tyr) deacylase [Candidatus Acetothermia bacterium]|nr:D-tyrosyl-tRNA(Tyr) deacylase [Candidatus Acetothermia bacterium]MBI3643490.1 D-tyrosyl-tRNA(Tyr) deacylase [Candidatus Acetothermia bacterium]